MARPDKCKGSAIEEFTGQKSSHLEIRKPLFVLLLTWDLKAFNLVGKLAKLLALVFLPHSSDKALFNNNKHYNRALFDSCSLINHTVNSIYIETVFCLCLLIGSFLSLLPEIMCRNTYCTTGRQHGLIMEILFLILQRTQVTQ